MHHPAVRPFTDVAQNYADYRPRYPQRLIDDLRKRTVGDRGGWLVDWGSGTGELAFPLSPFFDRVTAIDISAAKVTVAQANARLEGIENIEWLVGRAEDLEIAPVSCDLIAAGSSFHWMDRELLAKRAFEGLKPGAALVLVGGGGRDIRKGDAEWEKLAVRCVKKHVGELDEGDRPKPEVRKKHGEILTAAGFRIERSDYPTDLSLHVDEVVGYLYSIGVARILADRREAFEREFVDGLARIDPAGVFEERFDFYLEIAHKPGSPAGR